ncbi:MAG TPA: 5-formyltetrahydrofolate cyclo-ligase [Sphingomonadaceae bacterium]|nr:5-formyltetrahydrofolate cyclo-ligase [Sphingomonadaceae bacterium]
MHTATAVPSPHLKTDLRTASLARRRDFARSLEATLRGILEAHLASRVLSNLPAGAAVASYSPMRDEIDPGPIVQALRAAGHLVAFPWFSDRNAHMIFRAGPAVAPGPWGVLQPGSDAVAVSPTIVLVPLVAADQACNRIGHGKGHYDRALANLRQVGAARTIGLAWDCQIVSDPIPTDPWDIALDAVATPDRWIERNHV